MITIAHTTLALIVIGSVIFGMALVGIACAIVAKAWIIWEEITETIRFEWEAAANDREWRDAMGKLNQ